MSDPELRAGVARRDISPAQPELLQPTGMGRQEPTRGVLDALFVEALALSAGDTSVFVTTADLRYWPHAWVMEMRETISAETGCDPKRVLFSCTHNHCSSPIAANDSPEAKAAEAAANQHIRDSLVSACVEARASLRPAEIAGARAVLSAPVGQNRRVRMSDGTCVNGWGSGPIVPPGRKVVGPAGPDSTHVDCLSVREPDADRPFALFVSYSAHPHMYELPMFSGEFAGAAKRALAERIPDCVVLHANAAGGDIDIHCTHPMPDDAEERIQWFQESVHLLAARFADAVASAVPTSGYMRPNALRHIYESTEDEATDAAQPTLILNAVALGDVAFISLPGELFIELGQAMHERSPFGSLLIMGYNGSGGMYTPPPLGFEQGSYEVMRGPCDQRPIHGYRTPGPSVVDRVADALERLHSS